MMRLNWELSQCLLNWGNLTIECLWGISRSTASPSVAAVFLSCPHPQFASKIWVKPRKPGIFLQSGRNWWLFEDLNVPLKNVLGLFPPPKYILKKLLVPPLLTQTFLLLSLHSFLPVAEASIHSICVELAGTDLNEFGWQVLEP